MIGRSTRRLQIFYPDPPTSAHFKARDAAIARAYQHSYSPRPDRTLPTSQIASHLKGQSTLYGHVATCASLPHMIKPKHVPLSHFMFLKSKPRPKLSAFLPPAIPTTKRLRPSLCTMATPTDLHPGLQTVQDTPTPIPLSVTGKIPSYLHNTTLYRNGPGRYEVTHQDGRKKNLTHWFDGLALMHAFTIDAENNAVTYRSRFISDPMVRAIQSVPKRKFVRYTFGHSDPCRTVLGKMFQFLQKETVDPETGMLPANCAVTVQTIPGKGEVVARTDERWNAVLNEETLEVDHFFDFSKLSKRLCGPFSAAHGHYDKEKNEFINFNFDIKGPGLVRYHVFCVREEGTEIVATFDDQPSYLHSFATTERYIVMCVWPCRIDGVKAWFNRSLLDGMAFYKDSSTTFHVVSRELKRVVATFQSEAFFCFHTINAFEHGDAIHIDLCRYDDAKILEDLNVEALRYDGKLETSDVTRFTLDGLSTVSAAGARDIKPAIVTKISEWPLDLPRIHPELMRKEYRYVYGVSNSAGKTLDQIAKVDVVSGERLAWGVQRGVVGEPIFVNDPDGVDEDEGVLLVVVLDSEREKSDMVVLDAQTMTEVARAAVPKVVPLGFHGKVKQM